MMFATVLVSYVYQVHSAVRRLSIASIQRLDREQHQPGWGTPKGGDRGGGRSTLPGVAGGVFITTLSGSRDKGATSATHDPGIAEAYDSGRRTRSACTYCYIQCSPCPQVPRDTHDHHLRPPTHQPGDGQRSVGLARATRGCSVTVRYRTVHPPWQENDEYHAHSSPDGSSTESTYISAQMAPGETGRPVRYVDAG